MASRANLVTIPKSIQCIPVYGILGKKIQIQKYKTQTQNVKGNLKHIYYIYGFKIRGKI
jgi:hypothetical protein